MSHQPPLTPAEWLRFFADIAEKHRFTDLTPSGAALEVAFIAFLRSGAELGTSPLRLQVDLLMMLPRFSNALIQATHTGTACQTCAGRTAEVLASEIVSYARTIAERQNSGGLH